MLPSPTPIGSCLFIHFWQISHLSTSREHVYLAASADLQGTGCIEPTGHYAVQLRPVSGTYTDQGLPCLLPLNELLLVAVLLMELTSYSSPRRQYTAGDRAAAWT